MEFSIRELTDKSKNYFEISNDKDCLKFLKIVNSQVFIKVPFDTIGLGKKLYGSTKKETKTIQRQNCKALLSFYKVLKRAVKILIKKHYFILDIYVEDLSEKLNNNDLMILGLLNIDFNTKAFDKMKMAYEYACDFLDAENSLNNMCDFRDNRCIKHREKNIDKSTGCCPNFCKIRVAGKPCEHKNLACKIFMCDYLIDTKGYYFTPHTIPALKTKLTPLERAFCFGSLCKIEKKALRTLKLIRIVEILFLCVLIFCGYTILI